MLVLCVQWPEAFWKVHCIFFILIIIKMEALFSCQMPVYIYHDELLSRGLKGQTSQWVVTS